MAFFEEESSIVTEEYEGPLSLLVSLLQRQELRFDKLMVGNILEQTLAQLIEERISQGGPLLLSLSSLLLLKSYWLLPQEGRSSSSKEEFDFPIEVLSHIVEYALYREAGTNLAKLEATQECHYTRGEDPFFSPPQKPSGVDHLSTEALRDLMQELLIEAERATPSLQGELLRVEEAARFLTHRLEQGPQLFYHLFSLERGRSELIVSFLALLELMKQGKISAYEEEKGITLMLVERKE